MKKIRIKFYTERETWSAQAAVTFTALSVLFRLLGSFGLWGEASFAATQLALPALSGLLFILAVVLLGRKAFWSTVLPVLLGVVFFIIKATGYESWLNTVLCILLCLLAAVLYTGTALGLIHTKLPLLPLFGLPFLVKVFAWDLPALSDLENPVAFSAGMLEMSELCILLALFFISLAMKKEIIRGEEELPLVIDDEVIYPDELNRDGDPTAGQNLPGVIPAAEAELVSDPAKKAKRT